jgi:hypothetical protein
VQVLHPVKPLPPHCPYFSVTHETGEEDLLGEADAEVLTEGTALVGVAGSGAEPGVEVGFGTEPGVEVGLGTATGLELELGLGKAGVLGLLPPLEGAAMAGKLESSLRLQPVRATSSVGHCT